MEALVLAGRPKVHHILHSAHPRGDLGTLPPSSLQEQELLEEALSTLAQDI